MGSMGEDEAGGKAMVLLTGSGAAAWQAPSALAKQRSQGVQCMPTMVPSPIYYW
jgi:hypothetical protein